MNPPATKKQRLAAPKPMDFCLTISSPASFKNMCNIMDSILPHFQFEVVKNASFQGIKVRQMDEGHVTLLSIRYSCQVEQREKQYEGCEVPDERVFETYHTAKPSSVIGGVHVLHLGESDEEEDFVVGATLAWENVTAKIAKVERSEGGLTVFTTCTANENSTPVPAKTPVRLYVEKPWTFCVTKKAFRQFMKQINNTAVLRICQYRYTYDKKGNITGKNELLSILADDEEHGGKHRYAMKTLDVDFQRVGDALEANMEKPIKIDLEECKKFWRLCSSQECDAVRFRFLTPPFQAMNDGGVFHMSFRNHESGASGSRMFHAASKHDDEQHHEVAEEEDYYLSWKETYSQEFQVQFLNTFTKNLEKEQRLSIAIGRHSPLIINYSMGIENSHIRYYVAPKVEDDDMM